jgi:hypothetical protein
MCSDVCLSYIYRNDLRVPSPYCAGIKCLVWCVGDWNLTESCIWRPLNGPQLYLRLGTCSIILPHGYTWRQAPMIYNVFNRPAWIIHYIRGWAKLCIWWCHNWPPWPTGGNAITSTSMKNMLPYINIMYHRARHCNSCMLHNAWPFTVSEVGAVI